MKITLSTRLEGYEHTCTAHAIRLIGGVFFILLPSEQRAKALLNWIIEVTDAPHMLLELDDTVAEIIAIDLCFFDELLDIIIDIQPLSNLWTI